MSSLRDIKRRISSIQSTQKITSAMKMVSAAKLRRAQDAIQRARPYAQRMRETLEEVAAGSPGAEHILFDQREDKRNRTLEILAITSDRGLAGAFNSQVAKHVDELLRGVEDRYANVSLNLVGKKVGEYYARRRAKQIRSRVDIGARVTYGQAQGIARSAMERFAAGEIDDVVVVYNEFVSTMTQRPVDVKLLPFSPPAIETEDVKLAHEIEPSPERLLASLVPKAVEVQVFRAMLENQAGEHAARMTAMESATKNTEELIEQLTLDFNRARQAAITRELVEIVTGAQALE